MFKNNTQKLNQSYTPDIPSEKNYKSVKINDNKNNQTLNHKENINVPELPQIDLDEVDNLNDLELNEFPEDRKPKDLFNRIVQLKVSLENEEKSKKKKDIIQKQHAYKEVLDQIIEDKNIQKKKEKEEVKIWLDLEKRQINNFDKVEELNKAAKTNKTHEEKKLREQMIDEKNLYLEKQR